MPTRFLPIFEPIVAALLGGLSAIVAAVFALLPEPLAGAPLIIDDQRMRLVCVIGAIGGGLLSALIFTPPKATGRLFAIKVATSTLAGILFTPPAVHWLGWNVNVDTLLGLSAALAGVGPGAIRLAVPIWEKALGRRLGPPE